MTPQQAAEAMRERCAQECERHRDVADNWPKTDLNIRYSIGAQACATTIRALKVDMK